LPVFAVIEKLKFLETVAPRVVCAVNPEPPQPDPDEAKVPVKFTAFTVIIPLNVVDPEIICPATPVLVGTTQVANVSAKAEEDMTNPNAQNADTNLIKPLPFVLFIDPPFFYQSTKVHIFTNIDHISKYTTKLVLFNNHVYFFNKSSIYSRYLMSILNSNLAYKYMIINDF
jgi:hypothetical protein